MAKKPEETTPETGFAIAKENYIYLIIGFVVIILGFLLMMGGKSSDPAVFNAEELFSFRRITLAPLVVLAGFAFIIWAIMKKPGSSTRQ
jgi:hypothetical protein